MTSDEEKREWDMIEVMTRLAEWRDGFLRIGGDFSTVQNLMPQLLETIEKYYDDGYDSIEGGEFMDGLRRDPQLYRYTVGFFGGHDFIWKIKP